MPIIMATGQGDELVATEAMKRGASDYIVKTQINSESIKRSVESVLERAALRRKVIAQRTELENFAQMLVHDLSAPIASLQIFARLIEEELGLGTPNKREIIDHCRQVVSAGQRTSALLDALFEYTKAEANVTLAPVAMRRVMEDGLSNLKSVLQKRQARVSYGELPVVMGSAPQLMLLLQNLIGNAVKYCEAEPPVVRVTASLESSGTWLFAVKDNGIGIAEADRQKVFEPFKRLHNADDYQGSGLGLATCKKIVENHGGSIYCESASGEGTTFFFTLGRA